jgi:hypothetical protein
MNSGSNGGFTIGQGGNEVLVMDTQTGTVSLATHNYNNQTTTSYQDWGGATARGFTADGSTLVYDTSFLSWGGGFTNSTGDDYSRGIIAYDLATGNQRLLSHSADTSGKVYAGAANFSTMTPDGKWALFTANDASKFGNSGTAFTDSSASSADFFAVDVKSGEIRLLSGQDGVSNGSANTYAGLSDDGNIAYFTAANVNGLNGLSGTLVDNNTSGGDLVGVRLNLLDLATVSDTVTGSAGSAYDNITTSSSLTITAQLASGQSAELYDGLNLAGTATADTNGVASWSLAGVSSGVHHFTLVDGTEQIPILLIGNHQASQLDVTVL